MFSTHNFRILNRKKSTLIQLSILFTSIFFIIQTFEYCTKETELTNEQFFDLLETKYFQGKLFKVVERECSNPNDNSTCLYIIDHIGYLPDGTWIMGRLLSPVPTMQQGFLSVSKLSIPLFLSENSINTRDWEVDVGVLESTIPNGVEFSSLFSTGHFEANVDISGNVHFLGVATGGLISHMSHYFKNLNLTGIDIDPTSVYLAKKWFGYKDNRKSKIIIEDGAEYIRKMAERGEKSDAVLVDACHNNIPSDGMYCPVEVIRTPQFLENLSNVIGKRGMTVFNVYHMRGSSWKYEKLRQSFAENFKYCQLIENVPMVSNVFLICANYDFEKNMVNRWEVKELLEKVRLERFLQYIV